MKTHAVALRAIAHADDIFTTGQVIPGMSLGQFVDWLAAGLVREAKAEEVAAARGDKPAASRRTKAKARPDKAVPAPILPIGQNTPAEADHHDGDMK